MAPVKAVTDSYADILNALADDSGGALERLFRSLDRYDDTAALGFHDAARPLLEATAQAALDTTAGYLTAVGVEPVPPSELIVADASARTFDPFDRLGRLLVNGATFEDALAGALSTARALGSNAAFFPARTGMAQMGADMRDWQRRLSSGCCQWCMKLSSVVFDSASQALFGHSHCRCVPVPVDAVGDHNARIRGAEDFDAQAEKLFDQRHARSNIRKQVKTAQRRQAEAQRELLTETDPARRERLDTRAQQWETRAEAAAERLRIMETGTHRLPT